MSLYAGMQLSGAGNHMIDCPAPDRECDRCEGKGWVRDEEGHKEMCPTCEGEGRVKE